MQKLKFSRKIYKQAAIKKAVSAYVDLARFDLHSGKNYFEIAITPVNVKSPNVLIDEFSNYVLGMTKKCL